MKKIMLFILLATASCYSYALDGHNGIRFDMTQKQLESKGFICHPNNKEERLTIATCKHMDMSGVAFSLPTQNYEVQIGSDKRVAWIRADISGIHSMADYIALVTNISEFFPKKDAAGTLRGSSFRKDAWRDNNNAGISVSYFAGAEGVEWDKDTFWISFTSPSVMKAADKFRAEQAAIKARAPKEDSSHGNSDAL